MIKLLHGDCLELMKDIPDKSIDMILTDPPYLKAYSTGYRKGVARKTTEIQNDHVFDFDSVFTEYKRVTKPDAHIYIFGCWQTSSYFAETLSKYFKLKNRLIWVKNNWTAGDLFWTYGQSYEEIWYASNGRKKLNGGRDRDCLFYHRVAGKQQRHLNQKPVALLEYLIAKSTNENDVILDSFMGSGSTGIACINTKRNFIGIEKDDTYFEIAKSRIEKAQQDVEPKV